MARGRMMDKRVSNSKKLGKISDKSARLYFMIYPHLDKKGRIAFDDLDDLKTEIVPYLRNWGLKKISTSLNELADIGLIQLYPNQNKIAMEFDRFEDFQTIREDREAASKIVAPEEAPESSGVFRITPALRLSLRKVNEGSNEVRLFFDFDKCVWKNMEDKDIQRWKETYPACDIKQELLFMADWLISNPTKKKSNYKSFISRWLKKTQDFGGTRRTNEKIKSGQFDKLHKDALRK